MKDGKVVVMLVESDNQVREAEMRTLQRQRREVIETKNLQAAWKMFQQNRGSIDVIAIGDGFPEDEPWRFAREIRSLFGGKMIANCGNCFKQRKLIEAGCDLAASPGNRLPALVAQLFPPENPPSSPPATL